MSVAKSKISEELLRKAKLKRTNVRIALLDFLRKQHGPFTIVEILGSLKQHRLDKVTIYRNLSTFEDAELVRRCDFGDGVARFEFQTDPHHHHHHVICVKCRAMKPLSACPLPDLEAEVKNLGYTKVRHSMEFFGLCRDCSKSA